MDGNPTPSPEDGERPAGPTDPLVEASDANAEDRKGWDKWLTWNRDEAIIKLALEEKAKDESKVVPTTFHISGLAVMRMWWVVPMLWLTAFAMPFIGIASSTCPANGQLFHDFTSRYAWGVWVVVEALAMWREREAFKLVILPWCAMKFEYGQDMLFRGPCGSGCRIYTTWMMFISCLTKMDLISNGLLLAKVWMVYKCKEEQSQRHVWRLVMEESFLAHIPCVDHLGYVATTIWAMMFLQAFWCILHGIPWERKRKIEYGWKSEDKGYHTIWMAFCSWVTREAICDEELAYHADVVRVLAYNARMATLFDQNLEWTLARAKQKLKDNKKHAIAMFKKECSRTTLRVCFFVMIERGLMLGVQVTMLAISRHVLLHAKKATLPERGYVEKLLAKGMRDALHVDGQMLLGVGISFICFIQIINKHLNQFVKLLQCFFTDFKQSAETDEERSDLKGARDFLIIMALAFTVCLVITLHCLAKLVAVFQCESALWNVPIIGSQNVSWSGCVHDEIFDRH